ncbi:MAG: VCBS repeat-containing protein [Cyclobacteriaceae bacterium]
MKRLILSVFVLLNLYACNSRQGETKTVFQLLKPTETGILFVNKLTETEQINYFTYPYLYMGGGVGVIDVNNDGLQDLYFTANMGSNKLYLNKGNLRFEDITEIAGVGGDDRWDTGVAIADLNGDGLQDIYVSVSGKWSSRENLLYINNGDLTFTESAKALGLADAGHSTQASFIDYDRDGDLDVYVANYPPTPFKAPYFVYKQNLRNPKAETSDHLYRNDGGHFTDVTIQTIGLNFGLSLSASVADFNNDGWPDIYVSNDFAAPDFLYINNQNGSFSEKIQATTNHTAFYGMGTDAADFNNDGLIDLFQADMSPEDNFRSKANMASMDPEGFKDMVTSGLHYQYMENALNVNYGITSEGLPRFGDVSRMTGTALTDWSWSPLWVDLDNDGFKDLYVTNGSRRDINNKDYFSQFSNDHYLTRAGLKKESLLEKSLNIPSRAIENYVFNNLGELNFRKANKQWNLNSRGFSNGSAYADLDNDGDMDLVTNNIDEPASILLNNSTGNNWLQIKPKGTNFNRNAQGSRVIIETDEQIQLYEIYGSRGFQSASQTIAHFGLGNETLVDKVTVIWADGSETMLENVKANQRLVVDYTSSVTGTPHVLESTLLNESAIPGLDYFHSENDHNDFKDEVLLPHATSRFGPFMTFGDLNSDGLKDIFIGGAKNQAGKLFVRQSDGSYMEVLSAEVSKDAHQEDMGAVFFDADGDGDHDLYVVSGGNEEEPGSQYYQDRLYINNEGILVKELTGLPNLTTSGSKVKVSDFDRDGDLDLLVGGRITPKSYGIPAKTTLLRNDSEQGEVRFSDVTGDLAPELQNLGMVTDFLWKDINNDGWQDLVLVGEWMPITCLLNEHGKFKNYTEQMGWADTYGWWSAIASADVNGDDRLDFIIGNAGRNYKYQASEEAPFDLYVDDFDNNGTNDLVLGYYQDGVQFPVRGRQCSSQQVPSIKKKFADYASFARAELVDIYGAGKLSSAAYHHQVKTFESVMLLSDEDGYTTTALPAFCQTSAINAIVVRDFNADGHPDLLTAGNLFSSEVETKRNDASVGQLLLGDGQGNFNTVPYSVSGFMVAGDVKDMKPLMLDDELWVIVTSNDDGLKQFKVNNYLKN